MIPVPLCFFVPELYLVPVALLERRVKSHSFITNIMTPEFQVHHAEQKKIYKKTLAVHKKMVNKDSNIMKHNMYDT